MPALECPALQLQPAVGALRDGRIDSDSLGPCEGGAGSLPLTPTGSLRPLWLADRACRCNSDSEALSEPESGSFKFSEAPTGPSGTASLRIQASNTVTLRLSQGLRLQTMSHTAASALASVDQLQQPHWQPEPQAQPEAASEAEPATGGFESPASAAPGRRSGTDCLWSCQPAVPLAGRLTRTPRLRARPAGPGGSGSLPVTPSPLGNSESARGITITHAMYLELK